MAKASDNQFPSVLFGEGAAPASPAAGTQRVYIDTADHKVKRVNSAGVVTVIEAGAGAPKTLAFSQVGTLAVVTGDFRLYNDTGATRTITAVRASVGVAPAGASIIVDVLKNGTTIFTTTANRPTIAAAANTSGKVTNMDVTSLADGDYLTVNIAQVGSTTAGSDLTVQIELT
jgi:hypothetical protein